MKKGLKNHIESIHPMINSNSNNLDLKEKLHLVSNEYKNMNLIEIHTILTNFLSIDNDLRKNAESFLSSIITNSSLQDFQTTLNFLSQFSNQVLLKETLVKFNFDNNTLFSDDKIQNTILLLLILLKKIISYITSSEKDHSVIKKEFLDFFSVNNNSSNVILLLSALKGQKNVLNLSVLVIELLSFNFPECFPFDQILQFSYNNYLQTKNNNNIEDLFKNLYMIYQLIKSHERRNKEERSVYVIYNNDSKIKNISTELINSISNGLIQDQKVIINNFISELNNFVSDSQSSLYINDSLSSYLFLFFKINKHIVNLLNFQQREEIMKLSFDFICNLVQSQNKLLFTKEIIEIIFTLNRILIKYTAYVERITLSNIQNYSSLFYSYISNQEFISRLKSYKQNNTNNTQQYYNYLFNFSNDSSLSKQETLENYYKFISNILDYFKELFQLTCFDNWGDLILFKTIYSESQIEISDYLNENFFTQDKLFNLITFIIKNCLVLSSTEIDIASEDMEEFYNYFNNLSVKYDFREKTGFLTRIIYEKFPKEIKPILVKVDEMLNDCVNSNNNNGNNKEMDNMKFAILSFYEYIAHVYFASLPESEIEAFTTNYLFKNLMSNITNEYDYLSKYLSIRLIGKLLDYFDNNSVIKIQCFEIITRIFMIKDEHILLKIACTDFFYFYFDDTYFSKTKLPNQFLDVFVKNVCEMLNNLTSPDIQNNMIRYTSEILEKFSDDEIRGIFGEVFPVIYNIWQNNSNLVFTANDNSISNSNNSNQMISIDLNSEILNKRKNNNDINTSNKVTISVIRQNLLSMIYIFVFRVNPYEYSYSINNSKNNENTNNNSKFEFFEFLIYILGYSLNSINHESDFLTQESLRILLLIQDQFYQLQEVSQTLSLYLKNNNKETLLSNNKFSFYYSLYRKVFIFIPILLENIYLKEDYFLIQIFALENFISLAYINDVMLYLINDLSFVKKSMLIINKLLNSSLHLLDITQPIYNFIEYLIYILDFAERRMLTSSNTNTNNNNNNDIESISKSLNELYSFIFGHVSEMLESNLAFISTLDLFSLINTNNPEALINLCNSNTTIFPSSCSLNQLFGVIQIFNRLIRVLIDKKQESHINTDLLLKTLLITQKLVFFDEIKHLINEIDFYGIANDNSLNKNLEALLSYYKLPINNHNSRVFLNYLSNKALNQIPSINIMHIQILANYLTTLRLLFSPNSFNDSNKVNEVNATLTKFKQLESFGTTYLDNYNHTLDHWLFFFNKINCKAYYSNTSIEEDIMKDNWQKKMVYYNYLNVDTTDLKFESKFQVLSLDEVFKINK